MFNDLNDSKVCVKENIENLNIKLPLLSNKNFAGYICFFNIYPRKCNIISRLVLKAFNPF
jgi:hypothetical protein